MKLLVINGPNLNLLGLREPDIYGKETYDDLVALVEQTCAEEGIEVTCFQSNHEGAIVDRIQAAYGVCDGIVINPAAYTHTSVAIPDALKAVSLPAVEVHISDVDRREVPPPLLYQRGVHRHNQGQRTFRLRGCNPDAENSPLLPALVKGNPAQADPNLFREGKLQSEGAVHKTVNSHSSLLYCGCSCLFSCYVRNKAGFVE